MTEHGLLAAGKHGGEASPLRGERPMAHGVDAPVDTVDPAAGALPRDPLTRIPQTFQLPCRDQPVLPRRKRRNLVLSAPFVLHTDIKGSPDPDSPPGTSVRLARIGVSGCL